MNWLKSLFARKPQRLTRTMEVPLELAPFVEALQRPARWQPVDPLTENEQKQIREMLASPVLKKVDVIMYNQSLQQMTQAAYSQNSDTLAFIKFAAGYKAGWEAFKTLSVIPLTETRESERDGDTGADDLEHLNP